MSGRELDFIRKQLSNLEKKSTAQILEPYSEYKKVNRFSQPSVEKALISDFISQFKQTEVYSTRVDDRSRISTQPVYVQKSPQLPPRQAPLTSQQLDARYQMLDSPLQQSPPSYVMSPKQEPIKQRQQQVKPVISKQQMQNRAEYIARIDQNVENIFKAADQLKSPDLRKSKRIEDAERFLRKIELEKQLQKSVQSAKSSIAEPLEYVAVKRNLQSSQQKTVPQQIIRSPLSQRSSPIVVGKPIPDRHTFHVVSSKQSPNKALADMPHRRNSAKILSPRVRPALSQRQLAQRVAADKPEVQIKSPERLTGQVKKLLNMMEDEEARAKQQLPQQYVIEQVRSTNAQSKIQQQQQHQTVTYQSPPRQTIEKQQAQIIVNNDQAVPGYFTAAPMLNARMVDASPRQQPGFNKIVQQPKRTEVQVQQARVSPLLQIKPVMEMKTKTQKDKQTITTNYEQLRPPKKMVAVEESSSEEFKIVQKYVMQAEEESGSPMVQSTMRMWVE